MSDVSGPHSVQENFRELRDLIQGYARTGGPGDPWYDGEVALGRIEEQHQALQQKYDVLWQEQEHPFDKAEYDRLYGQLEALREAVRKGLVYAEACESWPSTPSEKEHYRQEVESMRAALNPAISPSECDGTRYCVAETHIHGCFAERAPATEPNEEEDDGLDPLRLDDVDGADPATGISDAELLRRVEKHTEPSPASEPKS